MIKYYIQLNWWKACALCGAPPPNYPPQVLGWLRQYRVLSPLPPTIRIKHACSTTETQPGKAFAYPKGNAQIRDVTGQRQPYTYASEALTY